MTMQTRVLASGPGWKVCDFLCSAGPYDPPFEERHETVSVAAVISGTFDYRTTQGAAFLAPGAVLLGNCGHGFECSHEHGVGDRCLSFHMDPAWWESIVAEVPGARTDAFHSPRIPPLESLTPLIARLEAASVSPDFLELEELACGFAGAVATAMAAPHVPSLEPSLRSRQRISDVIRQLEVCVDGNVTLGELARESGMSPYHFLRTFRQVVGMTPYQYLLRMRLYRAAFRLRTSNASVSEIAYEAGFGDLSTFNRRFRRFAGMSPTRYRRA